MIDTLVACLHRAAPARETLKDAGIAPDLLAEIDAKSFGASLCIVLRMWTILASLAVFSKLWLRFRARRCPSFRFTRERGAMIDKAGLSHALAQGRILECGALSYLRALGLMRAARFAITDSGGVQEETTALGVPCLTVRDNTERPITIEQGTNTLVGTSPEALIRPPARLSQPAARKAACRLFGTGGLENALRQPLGRILSTAMGGVRLNKGAK